MSRLDLGLSCFCQLARSQFSNISVIQNHQKKLKTQISGPTLRVSDLVGTGGAWESTSNRFPGYADARSKSAL